MTDSSDADFDERSALIVVDVQNDFADPDGSLYVDGGQDVIPAVNALVGAARRARALVVYTQDWHPETTPHFDKDGGLWPVHCVQGTWGAQLHPGLDVDGPVVRKGAGGEDGYSGFYVREVTTGEDRATELQALLDERGVVRVVVVGLAQDVCVRATAVDARRLGYETIVLLNATRAVNVRAGDDQRAVAAMEDSGVVVR
ncbi:MAG: isochorismatase family protein [Actinomycetota bacterium]|nr:isochorismatase family protein [Actinomycetota bacterium]